MTTQQGPTLGRCLLYYASISGLLPDGGSNRREICLLQVFKCQFPHPWISIMSQIPTGGVNLNRHSQHFIAALSISREQFYFVTNGTHKLCAFSQVKTFDSHSIQ